MQYIPVTFKYKGEHYKGELHQVFGGGADVWHLMINNYYYGMLMYTDKWVFHNPNNDMKELAEFFGKHVTDHKNKLASY